MVKKKVQKTLADVLEILWSKKRAWNVDTNLKIVVGGTEIGSIALTLSTTKVGRFLLLR